MGAALASEFTDLWGCKRVQCPLTLPIRRHSLYQWGLSWELKVNPQVTDLVAQECFLVTPGALGERGVISTSPLPQASCP